MGALFCPQLVSHCILPERFGYYIFDGNFPITERVVYTLDDLARLVHRYFSINKAGVLVVALFSLGLGIATYWLLQKGVGGYRRYAKRDKV